MIKYRLGLLQDLGLRENTLKVFTILYLRRNERFLGYLMTPYKVRT
jgi:hypothetical protein